MPEPDTLDVAVKQRREQEAALSERGFLHNLGENIGDFANLAWHGVIGGLKTWITDPKDAYQLLTSKESGDFVKGMGPAMYSQYKVALEDPYAYFHNHPLDAFFDTMGASGVLGKSVKSLGHSMPGATQRVVNLARNLSLAKGAETTARAWKIAGTLTEQESNALKVIRMGEAIQYAPDKLASLVFKEWPARAGMALSPTIDGRNLVGETLTRMRINPLDEARKVTEDMMNGVSLRLSLMESGDLEAVAGLDAIKPARRSMMDAAVRGALTPEEMQAAKFNARESAIIEASHEIIAKRTKILLDQRGALTPEIALQADYGEMVRRNKGAQEYINGKRAGLLDAEVEQKMWPKVVAGEIGQPEIKAAQAQLRGANAYDAGAFQKYYLWKPEERQAAALWAKEYAQANGLRSSYLPLVHEPVGIWEQIVGKGKGVSRPMGQFEKRSGQYAYNTDLSVNLARAVHNHRRLEMLETELRTLFKNLEPFGARRWTPGMPVDPIKEVVLPFGRIQDIEKMSANILTRTVKEAAAMGEELDAHRFMQGQLKTVRDLVSNPAEMIARFGETPAGMSGGMWVLPRGAAYEILDKLAPSNPLWYKMARSTTDLVKGGLLFLNLPWLLGNAIGNPFMYFMGGGSVGGLRRATMKQFSQYAPEFIRMTATGSADLMGALAGAGPLGFVKNWMTRWINLGQSFDVFFRKALYLHNVGEKVVQDFRTANSSMRTSMMSMYELDDAILRTQKTAFDASLAERVMNASRESIHTNNRQIHQFSDELLKTDKDNVRHTARMGNLQDRELRERGKVTAIQEEINIAKANYETVKATNHEHGRIAGQTAIDDTAFDQKVAEILKVEEQLTELRGLHKTASTKAYPEHDFGPEIAATEEQIKVLGQKAQETKIAVDAWRESRADTLIGRIMEGGGIRPSKIDLPETFPRWLKKTEKVGGGRTQGIDEWASALGFSSDQDLVRAIEKELPSYMGEDVLGKWRDVKAELVKTQATLSEQIKRHQMGPQPFVQDSVVQMLENKIAEREGILKGLEKDIVPEYAFALKVESMRLENRKAALKTAQGELAETEKIMAGLKEGTVGKELNAQEAMAKIQTLGIQNAELERMALEAESTARNGWGNRLQTESALVDTEQFFWNYNRLSYPERQFMRLLFPFWTWYSNVSKLIWRLPYISPGRTFQYHQFAQLTQDLVDDPTKPDFLRNHLPIGVNQKGDLLFVSLRGLNPLSNAITLSEADLLSRVHPLIQVAIETISGRAVFNQKPLGNDVVRAFNGREYELDPWFSVLRPRPAISLHQIPDAAWRTLMMFKPFRAVNEFIRPYTRTASGSVPEDELSRFENGRLMMGADILSLAHGFGASTITEGAGRRMDMMDKSVRRGLLVELHKQITTEARKGTPDSREQLRFLMGIRRDVNSNEIEVMTRVP